MTPGFAPHHPHGHHHHVACKYYNITIDGTGTTSYPTREVYEKAVLPILHRIHHTRTGEILFREFGQRSHHHLMKVIPLEGVFNAFAGADDLLHATAKGQIERSGADGSNLLNSAGKTIAGLGGGSNSTVQFTPLTFSKYCSTQKAGNKAGAKPDEILFHEMVHAMRQMLGVYDPLPLGFLYDTEEEFYAILIANIYASETGRSLDLRSDHHTFNHLSTDTDAKFLPAKDDKDYRYRLIDKLARKLPKLSHELSHVRTPFNPIRRYFHLQGTRVSMAH